jgi:hypothetical protein
MPMSEERGFEVVDKRGGREAAATETSEEAPESPPASASPDAVGEAVPEAEEGIDWEALRGFNPLAGITAPGILEMSFRLLAERAWIDMGMVTDPGTGEIKTQLDQAKLAIDVLGDLARHIEPLAAPDERREVQTTLTNLRLNFVRQRETG